MARREILKSNALAVELLPNDANNMFKMNKISSDINCSVESHIQE